MTGLFARVISRSVTPGPGSYNPTMFGKPSSPRFTLKSRQERRVEVLDVPYRKIPSSIGDVPRISLGSRHPTKPLESTPGPEYIPPTIGHDAKKSSLSSRQAGARDTRIDYPGPDRYNVRTPFAKGARSASLHSRPNDMFAVRSSGPGPAAYYPDYSLTRPSSPSPTMHIRTKVAEPQETAGYLDIGSTLGGPKFTIGRRENLDLVEI